LFTHPCIYALVLGVKPISTITGVGVHEYAKSSRCIAMLFFESLDEIIFYCRVK